MTMNRDEANATAIGRTATHIVDTMNPDPAPLNPAFWLFILELITELIQNCPDDPEGATSIANKPRFWGKRVLTVKVQRKMGGRRKYRKQRGPELVKAMLAEGKALSQDQMAAMFEEA